MRRGGGAIGYANYKMLTHHQQIGGGGDLTNSSRDVLVHIDACMYVCIVLIQ